MGPMIKESNSINILKNQNEFQYCVGTANDDTKLQVDKEKKKGPKQKKTDILENKTKLVRTISNQLKSLNRFIYTLRGTQ